MMREVNNRCETEEGRCPFDRMEGTEDGIDGRAVVRMNFEGEQGHLNMLGMLTALGNKISPQLVVHAQPCVYALHAVFLALGLPSRRVLHCVIGRLGEKL